MATRMMSLAMLAMSCSALTACATNSATMMKADRPAALIRPSALTTVGALKADPTIKAAFATIEGHREENVADLIEITEIPAPPFGEAARGKRIAEMFREIGVTDVRIDEVGNVIARRPGLTGEKTVAFVSHIDTVFPIETDVSVRREGDTYIAPGVGDNSRAVVVLFSLIKALDAHDIQTEGDVLFIGNVGEEGLGDLRGVKHLYRDGAEPIDSFIAIDGGRLNRLIHGGVGSHRYRVTVRGPGGHSWSDFGEPNPHHALGQIIELFDERAPAVTEVGPKTSYNVGRMGGGTSINSIPFESWMEVDMRSGDQGKLDDIDAVLQQAILDGLAAENAGRLEGDALSVDVAMVGRRPAGKAEPSQPLIQNAMAAMTAMGIEPDLRISSTDANIPISMGLPAITISRGGKSQGAHSFEERWTDIDSHLSIQLALLILLAEAGYATN